MQTDPPPSKPAPPWPRAGLDAAAWDGLAQGLAGSELWSVLLGVAAQRAAAVNPGRLMRQWAQDRFVQPAAVDQRLINALDAELLAAARGFDAVELAPLAPLGTCSALAPGSQNRIVSTMRGTEVVSDPTNVLALECARRLGADRKATIRLATCHRCTRAQPVPPGPGYAAHFRLFCLASAGAQQPDLGFTQAAVAEHIAVHLDALDRLQSVGCHFGKRSLKLMATPECEPLAQGVQTLVRAARPGLAIEQAGLVSNYYAGLRFMIDVQLASGERVLLIDGGGFDWLAQLLSNRRTAFVASGMGSQLAAQLFFKPPITPESR